METVLIVEHDSAARSSLSQALAGAGFAVVEANTAARAEQLASEARPTVILLELELPDADGVNLLRKLRAWCTTPVIVFSVSHHETDKIDALDSGADDYLTKPFSIGELLARLRVAVRHAHQLTFASNPVLNVGPFRVDQTRHEIAIDGVHVHLTPIEFKLFALLARHAGQVITYRQLLQEVWGPRNHHQTHHLRVHMAALRRKIEPDPRWPRWIVTEAGVGYRLRDQ
ncbi:MAG TPA: response regulator [Kofleriaceae bacterium]|nr:response regulator [Kofleriaceae bacterium]